MISVFMLVFVTLANINQICCPVSIEPSPTVEVDEHGVVTLTCHVTDESTTLWSVFPPGRTGLVSFYPGNQEKCEYSGTLFVSASVFCNESLVIVTITNVSRTENNVTWMCMSTGTGKSNTTIIVKVPTVAILNTSGIVSNKENDSLSFNCTAALSNPAGNISWLLDTGVILPLQGFHIVQNTTVIIQVDTLWLVWNTITLTTNRSHDGLSLFCQARNMNGKVSNSTSVKLNITYPPGRPRINITATNLVVIEGEAEHLKCSVIGGNPRPYVNWTCFTTSRSDEVMETVAIMEIIASKQDMNRSCQCISTYNNIDTSANVTLSVLYPPSTPKFRLVNNVTEVTVIKVIQNRNVSIDCFTDSNPGSSISWTYSVKEEILMKNNTLIFRNVNRSISGEYLCTTENIMETSFGVHRKGRNVSSVELSVLYPPMVGEMGMRMSINEGQYFSIKCPVIPGNPNNTNVTWTNSKDSREWTTDVLSLQVVNRSDDAQYTCRVFNRMQPTLGLLELGNDSKAFHLDVNYAPEIIGFSVNEQSQTTTVSVNENDPAIFTCLVDSKPGSMTEIAHDKQVLIYNTSQSLMYINRNSSCLDGGTYTCRAENTIYSGNGTLNIRSIMLNVNCHPRPASETDDTNSTLVASTIGQTAVISFTAIGFPIPVGKWYMIKGNYDVTVFKTELKNDGNRIITNATIHNRHSFNITFRNVSQDDFGQYKLELANDFGNYEHIFVLIPHSKTVKDDGLNVEDVQWSAIGGGVGSAILIIFAVAVITIYLSRKRNQEQKHHSRNYKNDFGKDVSLYANVAKDGEESLVKEIPETSLTEQETDLQEIDDKPDHIKEYGEYDMVKRKERVNVSDLYIQLRDKTMDFFGAEFMNIPNGLTMPYEVSQRPDNRPLNRYNGIYPYDHSRVQVPGNREFFINASYLEGLKRKKTYIASLGPTSVTTKGFTTFWQMVWSEKSDVIVMLTKLAEPSGIKCDRYWPEVGATITYGQITVTSEEEKEFAEYTSTRLTVALDRERRTVYHYFFTAWPDKRVPENVTCLIDFRRRVRLQHSKGPLIVHCSAGIGRTGTLIALDILIEQGDSKGYVNVFQCVKNMRDQRTNMVQTAEQYFFIYKALVNVLIFGCEYMSAKQISEVNKKRSDENMLNKMFQQLQKTVESDSLEEGNARSFNRHQKKKNRLGSDIPGDAHRVHLSPNRDMDSSDYINAVYVNSFTSTNHFIVAQTPLEDGVYDFLTMIFERDVSCIVSLDDSSNRHDIGEYNMTNQTVDFFHVTSKLLDTKENYIVSKITIDMSGKNNTGRKSVYHFQYTDWPAGQKVPEPRKFAEFVKDVEEYAHQLGSKTASVLVHCLTGSERSCLFAAVVCMAETMKHEGEVCVSNVLRKIKSRRPTAFPNFEQFKFCFEALSAFLSMENAGKGVEDAAYVNMAVG